MTLEAGVEVVCFDLGGVLVRICHSWEEACEAAELPLRSVPREFAPERHEAGLVHQVGGIADMEYFERTAQASRGAYSPAEVARIHHAWTRSEYPGAGALIDALRAAGRARLACLSNTNAAHWARLAPDEPVDELEYPSLQKLEVRLASHRLGLAKPNPEIFEVASREIAAAPARILLFDDRPENVQAARAAGWQAEQVDPAADPVHQMRTSLEQRRLL